ncbi:MAG: IMP dehydrogenase, partial [Planctomycetota bacterium]|nr:IMP dehydrogenase [Planctomycetota bacterium]
LIGGLRSGMDHVGAHTVAEFHEKGQFLRVSASSVTESHPHDIAITHESPNYTTWNWENDKE